MNQRLDKDAELMIDALRGIAAIMVLFSHAYDLAVAEMFGWNPDKTPDLWHWTRASLGNGDFWVWCFFVLSGLCIHRSIARDIAVGTFSWWRYVLARVTRIYPLFLLGLALAIMAWMLGLEFATDSETHPAPWPQLAASFLNLQIFTTAFPNFGPSWSLTCEVVYYAAWPAVLLWAGGRVSRAALLSLALCIGCMAGIFMIWHGLHRMQSSTAMDGLWTVCVLAPVWIAGAWLGGMWGSFTVSRRTWWVGILSCMLVILLEWVLRFKHYPVWGRHFTSWGAAPGLVILLAGAGHLHLSARASAEPVCRWLGQLSYPCYILHVPLITLVNDWGDKAMPRFAAEHSMLLTSLETLLVVLMLAIGGPPLERFFMNWRSGVLRRFTPPRKA